MLLAPLWHWTGERSAACTWTLLCETLPRRIFLSDSHHSKVQPLGWPGNCHCAAKVIRAFLLFIHHNINTGKCPWCWPWICSLLRSLAALCEVKAIDHPLGVTRRLLLSLRLMIPDLSFPLSEQTFVKEYNSDLRLIKRHRLFFSSF